MTPDTDKDASTAHDFIHALIMPLINPSIACNPPPDPTGVAIMVKRREVILLASTRNMGIIIGKGGAMVAALRQLLKPFGWSLQVPSNARYDLNTPPIEPMPEVRELAVGWLDSRYGPEAYRLAGEAEGSHWEIYVHPDHYDHADHSALETWAYNAARAQGSIFKIRLKPGGIVHA